MSTPEDRLARIEARLIELEDERAIREVLSRYGHYADACLDDDYFALFTEDCVMEVSQGRGDDPYAIVRWDGREQMKEFLAVRTAGHGDGFYGRSLHMQGNNLTLRIDGDVAIANNYSFILHQDGVDLRLVSASVNDWRLVRRDGRWLISERRRRMVGAPDTADILRASER
ncbi:nuclear transport factor 2 family protein [Nocardioides zeae]|uniref:Nuclear transport factor 2 family protein n=1 Tax=Nocardioides imazamoxiresistens TaxID=3231893 RepID=A0ABU3PTB7_9ACTN|nr:nuclear transport factor 2 family protein [Nocardioides zeae]MDT9592131.1 nuclear transport factor 2 family protein [Nocardioides zeae]